MKRRQHQHHSSSSSDHDEDEDVSHKEREQENSIQSRILFPARQSSYDVLGRAIDASWNDSDTTTNAAQLMMSMQGNDQLQNEELFSTNARTRWDATQRWTMRDSPPATLHVQQQPGSSTEEAEKKQEENENENENENEEERGRPKCVQDVFAASTVVDTAGAMYTGCGYGGRFLTTRDRSFDQWPPKHGLGYTSVSCVHCAAHVEIPRVLQDSDTMLQLSRLRCQTQHLVDDKDNEDGGGGGGATAREKAADVRATCDQKRKRVRYYHDRNYHTLQAFCSDDADDDVNDDDEDESESLGNRGGTDFSAVYRVRCVPVPAAREHHSLAGRFAIFGLFCRPACALAYLLERKWDRAVAATRRMFVEVFGFHSSEIQPALCRSVLRECGGPIDRAIPSERKLFYNIPYQIGKNDDHRGTTAAEQKDQGGYSSSSRQTNRPSAVSDLLATWHTARVIKGSFLTAVQLVQSMETRVPPSLREELLRKIQHQRGTYVQRPSVREEPYATRTVSGDPPYLTKLLPRIVMRDIGRRDIVDYLHEIVSQVQDASHRAYMAREVDESAESLRRMQRDLWDGSDGSAPPGTF